MDGEGCLLAFLGALAVAALVLAYNDGISVGQCKQACWSMGEEANTEGDGCWCSESGRVSLAAHPNETTPTTPTTGRE